MNHPEDDNGHDLFVPIREVEPLTDNELDLIEISLEKYT